jgi:DNA-binding LytR/AlgR family response regulator
MRNRRIDHITAGPSPWVYRVFAWGLISTLLAVIAPYQAVMGYGFSSRLGYWACVNAMAILVAASLHEHLRLRYQAGGLAVEALTALAQAAVIGPMVWLVNIHVFGFEVRGAAWLAQFTLIAFIVATCVALIRYEMQKIRHFALADHGGMVASVLTQPPRPAFLDRLETPLVGDVLMVSADNHYLEVVTTDGQGRVLMRFRDAMAELDDLPGFRIHRSHWVARSHLRRVRQDGRRYMAELTCGLMLPVSQAYVEDLRRAGLVEDRGIGRRSGTGPRTMA